MGRSRSSGWQRSAVRAATLEIWLIRDRVPKTPEKVEDLIREAASSDESRSSDLFKLGILGNRGVEPQRVFQTLYVYAHSPSPATRSAGTSAILSVRLVARTSSRRSAPRASSCRATWLPRNPVAPVTKHFMYRVQSGPD